MNRLIEAVLVAACSPWTSVVVASLSSLAFGAILVLRHLEG